MTTLEVIFEFMHYMLKYLAIIIVRNVILNSHFYGLFSQISVHTMNHICIFIKSIEMINILFLFQMYIVFISCFTILYYDRLPLLRQ